MKILLITFMMLLASCESATRVQDGVASVRIIKSEVAGLPAYITGRTSSCAIIASQLNSAGQLAAGEVENVELP